MGAPVFISCQNTQPEYFNNTSQALSPLVSAEVTDASHGSFITSLAGLPQEIHPDYSTQINPSGNSTNESVHIPTDLCRSQLSSLGYSHADLGCEGSNSHDDENQQASVSRRTSSNSMTTSINSDVLDEKVGFCTIFPVKSVPNPSSNNAHLWQ
jgi:hypothetical protein